MRNSRRHFTITLSIVLLFTIVSYSSLAGTNNDYSLSDNLVSSIENLGNQDNSGERKIDYSLGYRYNNELDQPISILTLSNDLYPAIIGDLLLPYDDIEEIDHINVDTEDLPTVEEMLEYDVVWVYAVIWFSDAIGLGNLLADYIDAGGAIVCTFSSVTEGMRLEGRIIDDEYLPFSIGGIGMGFEPVLQLGDFDTEHPIMVDVAWLSGGWLFSQSEITEGSGWVADWDNGYPLVGERGTAICVNQFLADDFSWDGDMIVLFHNSLIYAHELTAEGPELELIAEPSNPPVAIPANGGNFLWDATVINLTENIVIFDAWTELTLPNGSSYGPLTLFEGLALVGDAMIMASPTQAVPGFAPAGIYTYHAKVGDYPEVIAEDSFEFEKLGGFEINNQSVEDWIVSGWFEEINNTEPAHRTNLSTGEQILSITNVHPNPFNVETQISFDLTSNALVNIKLFDVVGREVIELTDQHYIAGSYNVQWDGTGFSSGVYFVTITATGDNFNIQQTGKIMLLK